MKKAAIQIAVLAVILMIVCVACRLGTRNTYVASIPTTDGGIVPEDLRFSEGDPAILLHGTAELRDGGIRVPIRPGRSGETFLDVNDAAGNDVAELRFHVSRFGTIYDYATGGFTGDSVALVAFTVFCLAVAAIMLWVFLGAKGPGFYAYNTIYAAGFSIFAGLTGLMMLRVTVRHLARPGGYDMLSAYRAITGASWRFLMVTAPLLLVFAAAMAVSNVVLLRHERFRPKNVLGIGIALTLAAGEALAYHLYTRGYSGPIWDERVRDAVRNVYSTGFAYFECMLIGAVICGVKAARHVPEGTADFILILGCAFRKDGTLTPQLKGRVDKAIEVWKRQRTETGSTAILMPSGGQGPDEPMAEAEAMRRYLLERGIPSESVVKEDRSRNTYQNMAFSKALIDRAMPGARVFYATTNYHVFRSGVWASLADLPAEGVGSDTRWWYWPNAFMRECAGLMLNRIPQELALLVVTLTFFGTLSILLA